MNKAVLIILFFFLGFVAGSYLIQRNNTEKMRLLNFADLLIYQQESLLLLHKDTYELASEWRKCLEVGDKECSDKIEQQLTDKYDQMEVNSKNIILMKDFYEEQKKEQGLYFDQSEARSFSRSADD
jgi:hypothetical protein